MFMAVVSLCRQKLSNLSRVSSHISGWRMGDHGDMNQNYLTAFELESRTSVGRFRFRVMAALWVTGAFLYLDRVAISVAAPSIMDDLGLSGVQMAFILGTFFWGYSLGQIVGGLAADKLKIRTWTILWYLVWCVAVAATGVCRSVPQFSIARVIFGFAEGAVINPVTKLQNHWVFPRERGISHGVQVASAYMALVIGTPLMSSVVAVLGWRAMFFLVGAATLLGAFLFWRMVYDHPREHPRIPRAEMEAIEDALSKDRVTYEPTKSARNELSFMQSIRMLSGARAYWAICGSFFFIAGIYFTNFSWLPTYLIKERGFSGLTSGFALALPYSAAAVGALLSGVVADKLAMRAAVIIAATALTIPAIAGLLAAEQDALVIAMLCLVLCFNGAAMSLFVVLLFDLLPAQVIGIAIAVLVGVFGGLGGVVGPLVMGYSYDRTGSFATGFFAMAGGLVIAIAPLCAVHSHEMRVIREKARKALLGAVQPSAGTRT